MSTMDPQINAIWKKIPECFLLKYAGSPCKHHEGYLNMKPWYNTYKILVSSIYKNDNLNVKKYSNDLKQHDDMNQIESKIYHDVVNNLMSLLCIYCEDVDTFAFFVRKFNEQISTDCCEPGKPVENLGLLVQRPCKPIDMIKTWIQFIDSSDLNSDTVMHNGGKYNCLQTAVKKYDYRYRVSNLCLIQYMVDELKMDLNKVRENGDDILKIALCNKKSDVHLVQYLFEHTNGADTYSSDQKMELYLSVSIRTFTAILEKKNINNYCKIIQYLIQLMDFEQIINTTITSSTRIYQDTMYMKKIIQSITQSQKLNAILSKFRSCGYFDQSSIATLIRDIDPGLLNDKHCAYAGNPWINLKYKEFIQHMDDIQTPSNYLVSSSDSHLHNHNDSTPLVEVDNTEPSVRLFYCNKIPYYGNPMMFDLIDFFKDSQDLRVGEVEFQEEMPKYLINLYLNQTLSGRVDLSPIDPMDIIKFIKFIDKYPTQTLAIHLIEKHLLRYIDLNQINVSDDLMLIFEKYGCKYLMLSLSKRNCPQHSCHGETIYDAEDRYTQRFICDSMI
jgi:hypothetical protein